jgi:hypothetical protein
MDVSEQADEAVDQNRRSARIHWASG